MRLITGVKTYIGLTYHLIHAYNGLSKQQLIDRFSSRGGHTNFEKRIDMCCEIRIPQVRSP